MPADTIEKLFKKHKFIRKMLLKFDEKEKLSESDIEVFHFLFIEKTKKYKDLAINYNEYKSFKDLTKALSNLININKINNLYIYDFSTIKIILKLLKVSYYEEKEKIVIPYNDINTFEKISKIFPSTWCIKDKTTFNQYLSSRGDFKIYITENDIIGVNDREDQDIQGIAFDKDNKECYEKLLEEKIDKKSNEPLLYKIKSSVYSLKNHPKLTLSLLAFAIGSFIPIVSVFLFIIAAFLVIVFALEHHALNETELRLLKKTTVGLIAITLISGIWFGKNPYYKDGIVLNKEAENYFNYNIPAISSLINMIDGYIMKESDINDYISIIKNKTMHKKVIISEYLITKYNLNLKELEKIDNETYKGSFYKVYITKDTIKTLKTKLTGDTLTEDKGVSLIIQYKDDILNEENTKRFEIIKIFLDKFKNSDVIKESIVNNLLTESELMENTKQRLL